MGRVETVLFLVILATVVATFARRLRVPAPSLLVIDGVVVGLVPDLPAIVVLAPDDVRQEHTAARLALAHAGLSHLEYLTETATAPESVLKQLRTIWQNRIERINEPMDGEPPASIYRQLRQDLLDVENAELDRLYHDGVISDATRRQIQRSLDLEYTGLGEAPEAR